VIEDLKASAEGRKIVEKLSEKMKGQTGESAVEQKDLK